MAKSKGLSKKFKAQWVKALRSGNYSKGKYSLRKMDKEIGETTPSYCCLGVACDLYAKANPKLKLRWRKDKKSDSGEYSIGSIERGSNALKEAAIAGRYSNSTLGVEFMPASISEALNITPLMQAKLANMNDEEEDFEKIAKYIEKNY